MSLKSLSFLCAAALVLSACGGGIPESGGGVGFDDYSRYELERAAGETQVVDESAETGAIDARALAELGIGEATEAEQPVEASPTNEAPQLFNNPSLSDEQDFDAVADRESIESDAERRAQQAAAYQLVDPGMLPSRDGSGGPNIVEYALNAPNSKGQEWYSRFIYSGQGRFQRNCAKYASPDDAQRDFLARGGPERDPRGIDPDGDGFACGWDPEPFRAAVRAVQSEAGN